MLIYAIGDVHGMHDRLLLALEAIKKDAGENHHVVVFLGDYVDRGPNSAGVVGTVKALVQGDPNKYLALLGNHEDWMIALEHDLGNQHWSIGYGRNTIDSYRAIGDDLKTFHEHCEWLRSIPFIAQTENHIFVHAGLNPAIDLHEQKREHLLWIRGWENQRDWGKHVVYGHSVFREPWLLGHSTGLDTGCVFGGRLSVGVFNSYVNGGPTRIISL